MSKSVVILGAGWTGLPLAHKLLKYTVPKLPSLKVILVSPNSHFFWNVAASRGIIPGEIPDKDLFIPIEPAFKKHDKANFEFVLGSATSIDDSASSVELTLDDGSRTSIKYDHLVIATGSHISSSLPLKLVGSHEKSMAAWHGLQERVSKAKSIVVAGGGPTGIEVAGELAAKYGNTKQITLIISEKEGIPAASSSVRSTVTKDLQMLRVRILSETRVTGAEEDPAITKWNIWTTNTSCPSIEADLYLPCNGVTVNSSFIPEHLKDKAGNLDLQGNLRSVGAANIWGIGDIGNVEPKQLTVTDNQIIHLAKALDAVLTTSNPIPSYKPMDKTMIFVSLGRNYGTGQIGNWKLWGFLVNYVKGRKLFVDTAKGYVGGEHLRHAKM